MNATTADLALVIPELMLVLAASALLLGARRIRTGYVATVVTVVAALAAIMATVLGPSGVTQGFGGMMVLDDYTRFFRVLIAATLALTALMSVKETDDDQVPRGEYHVLLLLAAVGMMLAASALDLLPLYLALELVTLCSYILVGITVDRPASNEAAIKYFLLGSFASALFLYGISLTYGFTGATDYQGISAALSGKGPFLLVGIGLVVAGLAFKIAAAPFHAWAPDAYQGASTPVAAFLAAGAKAAGLAALGRVCVIAFGTVGGSFLPTILAGLAALSILVGSILALSQTEMKRLLAYSSIAHAGYALLGLLAMDKAGAAATMTYAFFYVFMTLGTFGVVIALGSRGKTLDGYKGLASQRPGIAALMLLFLLSLAGIPLTSGFAAKFVVILSAVNSSYYALAVLAVLCSVVTAFIYLRVAVLMYMREPEQEAPPSFPKAMYAALAVAAWITLLGGLSPAVLEGWAKLP